MASYKQRKPSLLCFLICWNNECEYLHCKWMYIIGFHNDYITFIINYQALEWGDYKMVQSECMLYSICNEIAMQRHMFDNNVYISSLPKMNKRGAMQKLNYQFNFVIFNFSSIKTWSQSSWSGWWNNHTFHFRNIFTLHLTCAKIPFLLMEVNLINCGRLCGIYIRHKTLNLNSSDITTFFHISSV